MVANFNIKFYNNRFFSLTSKLCQPEIISQMTFIIMETQMIIDTRKILMQIILTLHLKSFMFLMYNSF